MFPHPRVRREGAEAGTGQDADAGGSAEGGAGGGSAGTGGASDTAAASAYARPRERLSLVESMLAEVGGWTSAIVGHCHLPLGPFLVSDGVVHMDLAIFRGGAEERTEPPVPE